MSENVKDDISISGEPPAPQTPKPEVETSKPIAEQNGEAKPEPEEQVAPKQRGRPPGAKNKPKEKPKEQVITKPKPVVHKTVKVLTKQETEAKLRAPPAHGAAFKLGVIIGILAAGSAIIFLYQHIKANMKARQEQAKPQPQQDMSETKTAEAPQLPELTPAEEKFVDELIAKEKANRPAIIPDQ